MDKLKIIQKLDLIQNEINAIRVLLDIPAFHPLTQTLKEINDAHEAKTLSEAERLWREKRKLDAVKLVKRVFKWMSIMDAKEYCNKKFN